MNSLIIENKNGYRAMYLCSSCRISYIGGGEECKETVPIFSEKQAIVEGWRKTDDLMFCDPKKKFVWICPDCWPGGEVK